MKATDPSSRSGMVDNELTISVVGIQSRLFLEERIDNKEESELSEMKGKSSNSDE